MVRYQDGREVVSDIARRHHLPAFVRRLAWLRGLPSVAWAEIRSFRGVRLYPGLKRRRNNPHLRQDGDRDLPSTLTRD